MAMKRCQKCGQEKTLAHFIACENSIVHSGTLPICRECITEIIRAADPDQKWNVVNKLCQWADIPFVPEEWQKIYKGNGAEGFGVYAALFKQEEYKTLDWQMYNEVYNQLDEEERIVDALPAQREKEFQELVKKWGDTYDVKELEYLENLHQGLLLSQNVVGALNEDQALKLCKISLVIEDKIRSGIDFTKDLKAYDELAKLANLTPKNVKEANEFDSFGEVFAYMEKTGTVLPYYDNVVRDEVDYTIKNMKNWLRYLYVNETGVGDEIDQRIENLRTAAALEDDNFDEKDFRQYMKHVDEDDEDEEFRIDVE